MKRFEGGFIGVDNNSNNEILSGREAISIEAALKAQEELIRYLTPAQIVSLFPEDRDGVLLEALTQRYMEKYVSDAFNGFAAFCDQNSNDKDLINRINTGQLTSEDFEKMKMFLESHDEKGRFFESENEIDNFIKKYLG